MSAINIYFLILKVMIWSCKLAHWEQTHWIKSISVFHTSSDSMRHVSKQLAESRRRISLIQYVCKWNYCFVNVFFSLGESGWNVSGDQNISKVFWMSPALDRALGCTQADCGWCRVAVGSWVMVGRGLREFSFAAGISCSRNLLKDTLQFLEYDIEVWRLFSFFEM